MGTYRRSTSKAEFSLEKARRAGVSESDRLADRDRARSFAVFTETCPYPLQKLSVMSECYQILFHYFDAGLKIMPLLSYSIPVKTSPTVGLGGESVSRAPPRITP